MRATPVQSGSDNGGFTARVRPGVAPSLRLVTRDLAAREEVDVALVAVGAPGGIGVLAMSPHDVAVPPDVLELAGQAASSGQIRIDAGELLDGRLGTIVSAPLRLPRGAVGALCTRLEGPPPAPGADIVWLTDSYARLVSLGLGGNGVVGGLLAASHDDALTGCVSYPTLIVELTREVERCRRWDQQLACFFCRVDGHRSADERVGLAHSDRVLAEVGHALRQLTRASDTVGRFGADEFVILSPGSGPAEAAALAERIRAAIRDVPVLGAPGALDVRLGYAQWHTGLGPAGLIGEADAALREARSLPG